MKFDNQGNYKHWSIEKRFDTSLVSELGCSTDYYHLVNNDSGRTYRTFTKGEAYQLIRQEAKEAREARKKMAA